MLKKVGDKTELAMVHSKVPKSQMKDYADGLRDYYWNLLQEYFGNK